ncbi:MAG TPA: hypothetical protein P5244_08005 [Syntrophales bacterium]|nr:hypothetical protein [Syntrophales bacterium]HRT84638.1 hypothetical protein [Bacteroidales bacterium]
MKVKLITALCIIALCILTPIRANAQASGALMTAKELVKELIKKGGQQGAKELMKLGGETLAREALEKAAQEGGEKLVQKLATQTLEHGAALLKVAKQSPLKFVSAFDELTPSMQKAAAQAITREPDLIARLFSNVGKDSLIAAAQHPGVGTQVMDLLGKEGAEALCKITTDQAIQLNKLAPKIAQVAEPQRRTLMQMIEKAPKKIMDLLEKHPKVMLTGAGVAAFIAAKDQILGDPYPKHGFIERIVQQIMESLKAPLSGLIWIGGVIMFAWGCIKLWAVVRREKLFTSREMEKRNRHEVYAKSRDSYSDSKKDPVKEEKTKEKSDDQMIL